MGAKSTTTSNHPSTPEPYRHPTRNKIKKQAQLRRAGDMVTKRDENKLLITWRDKRDVTVLFTIHNIEISKD